MEPISTIRDSVDFESLFSNTEKKGSNTLLGKIAGLIGCISSSENPGEAKLTRAVNEVKTIPRKSEMTIAWASDIHLDHADEKETELFFKEIADQNPSLLLLAGDIEMGKENPVYGITQETIPAKGLVSTIKKIREKVACPIYFICGNHDFYFSSFKEVRADARQLSETTPGVSYIHETPGIELSPDTVLVGHDGWADSRSGNFWKSDKVMMDFFHIQDFNLPNGKAIYTPEIKSRLEKMGDQSAEYAKQVLPNLLKKYHKVIFLTHVPPYRESSLYEGHLSDDSNAPFFVNQTLGVALKKIMQKHPENELLVLCGHTHTPATYRPLPNLTVLTAGAEYGQPHPQQQIRL